MSEIGTSESATTKEAIESVREYVKWDRFRDLDRDFVAKFTDTRKIKREANSALGLSYWLHFVR